MDLIIWTRIWWLRVKGKSFDYMCTINVVSPASRLSAAKNITLDDAYRAVPTVLSVPLSVTVLYGEPDQVMLRKEPITDKTWSYVYGVSKMTVSVPGDEPGAHGLPAGRWRLLVSFWANTTAAKASTEAKAPFMAVF